MFMIVRRKEISFIPVILSSRVQETCSKRRTMILQNRSKINSEAGGGQYTKLRQYNVYLLYLALYLYR